MTKASKSIKSKSDSINAYTGKLISKIVGSGKDAIVTTRDGTRYRGTDRILRSLPPKIGRNVEWYTAFNYLVRDENQDVPKAPKAPEAPELFGKLCGNLIITANNKLATAIIENCTHDGKKLPTCIFEGVFTVECARGYVDPITGIDHEGLKIEMTGTLYAVHNAKRVTKNHVTVTSQYGFVDVNIDDKIRDNGDGTETHIVTREEFDLMNCINEAAYGAIWKENSCNHGACNGVHVLAAINGTRATKNEK